MSRSNQSKLQHLNDVVKQCSPEVILRAASLCNGHAILLPDAFTDAGLPGELVEYLTRDHRSDGSPKGTLFVDGQAVASLRGVYGLDLLKFLASSLHVEYRAALGRGFEAANIQTALRQHFAAKSSTAVPPVS